MAEFLALGEYVAQLERERFEATTFGSEPDILEGGVKLVRIYTPQGAIALTPEDVAQLARFVAGAL